MTVITTDPDKRSFSFRPYSPKDASVPITCVTPDDGSFTHTFFDVCPFSPCGQFLAVTRFPYQGKKPVLGDAADICIIDLENQTITTVYRTLAWSYQLGANIQWGPTTERALYANEVVDGKAVCVRIDLDNCDLKVFDGPKYDLATDATFCVGPDLALINATQDGYGIPDPEGSGPPSRTPKEGANEGIWRADLINGGVELIASLNDLESVVSGGTGKAGAVSYPFHTRLNRQGTHILQVLRFLKPGSPKRNPCLLTFSADGSGFLEAINQEMWSTRGRLGGRANHPNWHPDGERILLNMVPRSLGLDNLHFCLINRDGTELNVLSERHLGSGHPSIDPSGRFLLTDAYPKESWIVSTPDRIPIRILDLENDIEIRLCTVPVDLGGPRNRSFTRGRVWRNLTRPLHRSSANSGASHYKLDPHPSWDRTGSKVCFNGVSGGMRQVFIADLPVSNTKLC